MFQHHSIVVRPCCAVMISTSSANQAPLHWLRALCTQKCPFPCQKEEGELHNLSEFTEHVADHARRRTQAFGPGQPRGALG